ncbi:MAG: ComEC/Rec2-related protein [Candidatus Berkelbacteria bacterium]|nr:ComEC/Rec2-related protein [Candidatus Berkelbacteria bacterium]
MINQVVGKSYLVTATLSGFIVGIFFGNLIGIDLWWLLGISLGLIIAIVIMWCGQSTIWRMVLLILIGLTVGLSYSNLWAIHQKSSQPSYDKEQSIEAQIVGHPDASGAQTNYVLKYGKAKIRLTTGRYPEYHYGDILKFKGTLKESYPYFYHQGILGQVYNPEKIEKIGFDGNIANKTIYQIRDKFEESLNKSLSEPYASFAAGLILGSKRNIPDSLMSDFNRTGTTHIVAVSGYNVTIIITYIALLLGIFSRKLKFWGSLVIILSFIIMTGASASVVRAGVLAGLVLLGHYEGRRINMTILIALTATVMLLFNPFALNYDIGFQLSFLAFIGLVYLSPQIAGLKTLKILPKFLQTTFSETMAAQIMVFPILIYYFGRVSVISPIVNILILWIIPLTMAVVFAVGLFGIIWLSVGQIFGYLDWVLLKYIIFVIQGFSKISWASYNLKVDSWWWLPIIYCLIGLLIFKNRKMSQKEYEPY